MSDVMMVTINCVGGWALGVALILPAIVIGWVFKWIPNKYFDNMPPTWTNGLVLNTIIAYRRYSMASWVRRLVLVFIYPSISFQYIKILQTKQSVQGGESRLVRINDLIPQHETQTSHPHHRHRVEQARLGKVLDSFSPIIVVDNTIHDGHHRIAAYKEAGLGDSAVECLFYTGRR